MSKAGFDMRDFLRTRKNRVVDVEDVRDALEIYQRQLLDDDSPQYSRLKFLKTKVQRIESSMTPAGVKKLNDARKTLRMRVEASRRRSQRSEELPPIQDGENYGFDDGPDEFIRKMQQWGEYPVDDRRYYLHMVFRYYFKQYHDHAVSSGVVIPHPSYQYILDTLLPNDCANRFPPEFRRFLDDSAGRKISVRSLPVPVKGSAREVAYDHNFEAIPHVSTLRRKIESVVLDWKSGRYEVYPAYLRKGDRNNEFIIERECHARKVRLVKEGLQRLVGVDLSKFQTVCAAVPTALTAYDDYTLHLFRTPGEQLIERMGFFMRSAYRNIFYALNENSMAEDLFEVSGAGMEVFIAFQTFCTYKAATGFEKDECLCRALLMVIVDVCFLFHVFKNRSLADEDPANVMKAAVEEIEEIENSCG